MKQKHKHTHLRFHCYKRTARDRAFPKVHYCQQLQVQREKKLHKATNVVWCTPFSYAKRPFFFNNKFCGQHAPKQKHLTTLTYAVFNMLLIEKRTHEKSAASPMDTYITYNTFTHFGVTPCCSDIIPQFSQTLTPLPILPPDNTHIHTYVHT